MTALEKAKLRKSDMGLVFSWFVFDSDEK